MSLSYSSYQDLMITRSRISWFRTLGLFLGRALLDSRIVDVNLNTVFLNLILGKSVKKSIANLKVSMASSDQT